MRFFAIGKSIPIINRSRLPVSRNLSITKICIFQYPAKSFFRNGLCKLIMTYNYVSPPSGYMNKVFAQAISQLTNSSLPCTFFYAILGKAIASDDGVIRRNVEVYR